MFSEAPHFNTRDVSQELRYETPPSQNNKNNRQLIDMYFSEKKFGTNDPKVLGPLEEMLGFRPSL